MRRVVVLTGLLLCGPALTSAEVAYVTDILRLGLHQAQDTSDRAFRTLVSGTELEVLARVPNYARVRTLEGQEGWVKAAYLVEDKPAQLRVSEVEAEIERLRGQLEQAETARMAAERETAVLSEDIRASSDSSQAIQSTLSRLKQENESYESRLDTYRGSVPLTWVGAALLVALIAGFIAGVSWLDYVSRRRHGGFRIY
jgi:SH3 domain protein